MKLNESFELDISSDDFLDLILKFEYYPKLLPQNILSTKIVSIENNIITTEEKLFVGKLLGKTITQKSTHEKKSNQVLNQIISGPAKDTTFILSINSVGDKSLITVDLELHLSLQYKILQPIIQKWYKRLILSMLYRLNTIYDV